MKPEHLAYRTKKAREAKERSKRQREEAIKQRAAELARLESSDYVSINEGLPHGSFEWF